MKIIFDYNRTLFNPETDSLYEGVLELLQKLSGNNELFLVSKNEPGRMDKLEEARIIKYFKSLAFVEEKTMELFQELAGNDKNAMVIGDRVKGEIKLGNRLGFQTIWVQQGKFADELPVHPDEQPTITVKNIKEVQSLLAKYEK